MKRRTTIVAVAATKGGVGKTTLTAALAVRAAKDKLRVALIDTDPQPSLSGWWVRRGKPDVPSLFPGIDGVSEAIEHIISKRWNWVFIDTPPGAMMRVEPAIMASDFVLIPVRSSALDVEAVRPVVEVCQRNDKPFAVVVNQDFNDKLTTATVEYLRSHGCPVLETTIGHRVAYVAGMTVGKSGPEVERDGKARKEIEALWTELQGMLKG